MQLIESKKVSQAWVYPEQIKEIFNYKDPSKKLKAFREFVQAHPNYYKWFKQCWLGKSIKDFQYAFIPLAHFWENQSLLEAGSRSIKFDLSEIERIRITYGL